MVTGLTDILDASFSTGTRIEDNQDDLDNILELHNTFRARHGAQPLIWSEELVGSAAAWAKECKWEHSSSEFRSGAGENLYAGVGSPVEDSYNAAAIGWYNEIEMYNFDDPSDLSKTRRGFVDIGHFTSMVWAATDELGCARQMCPPNEFSPFSGQDGDGRDWTYVVCHYREAGNRLSAGDDEYKLFRKNVPPVLAEIDPLPPIRSCASDTVSLDVQVTAIGSTCAAAETLMDAIEDVANTLICRHGWKCTGYDSTSMPFTTMLTLEVPATDVERVTSSLLDDGDLLEVVWSAGKEDVASITIRDIEVTSLGEV